jgi:cobalamin biosynthesis protein CobT
MGTWSGEPFGNDSAADWAWELDDSSDWEVVRGALEEVLDTGGAIDADDAIIAIAAAEVVARGLGRPSEQDADNESVDGFISRAPKPGNDLVDLALRSLEAASGPNSELTELWTDSDASEWIDANSKLRTALLG